MNTHTSQALLENALHTGPLPPHGAPQASTPARRIVITVPRDQVRSVTLEDGVTIYHAYPTIAAYLGSVLPSATNPRSHHDEAMHGLVHRAIAHTITTTPHNFYLANRGITVLAQAVEVNSHQITIHLSETSGPQALHGIADGGTTDLVIAHVQQRIARRYHTPFHTLTTSQIDAELKEAHVHLEIIVGLDDRSRIGHLVAGRNTSRQVTTWSLMDFQGGFAWLKGVLEHETSPVKGKIGYEQNALEPVSVMEVIALMSLFHPMYNQEQAAPTVAYAARGKLDHRLINPKTATGYHQLSSVLYDIVRLYDTLYLAFPPAYKAAVGGRGKLSLRRDSAGERLFPARPHVLYLTGQTSPVTVPQGLLYPLLAAFRGLLVFPPVPDQAYWDWEPFQFLDRHVTELVRTLFTHVEALHNNPAIIGKAKSVYLALTDRVRLLAGHPTASDHAAQRPLARGATATGTRRE